MSGTDIGAERRLILLTPSKNVANLERLYRNIVATLEGIDWNWIVCEDGPEATSDFMRQVVGTGPDRRGDARVTYFHLPDAPKPTFARHKGFALSHVGHPLRNHMLDILQERGVSGDVLVMHLDDDTLLHPNLPAILAKFWEEAEPKGAVGFTAWQQYIDGTVRLLPSEADPPVVDTGAFVVKLGSIGTTRFACDPETPAEEWYSNDQGFFQALYKGHEFHWEHYEEPGSLYNALREETGPAFTRSKKGIIHQKSKTKTVKLDPVKPLFAAAPVDWSKHEGGITKGDMYDASKLLPVQERDMVAEGSMKSIEEVGLFDPAPPSIEITDKPVTVNVAVEVRGEGVGDAPVLSATSREVDGGLEIDLEVEVEVPEGVSEEDVRAGIEVTATTEDGEALEAEVSAAQPTPPDDDITDLAPPTGTPLSEVSEYRKAWGEAAAEADADRLAAAVGLPSTPDEAIQQEVDAVERQDIAEYLSASFAPAARLGQVFPLPPATSGIDKQDHGFFKEDDAESLTRAVALAKERRGGQPVVYLELGSWLGKSCRHVLDQLPTAIAICIDTWDVSWHPQNFPWLPVLWETFVANMDAYRGRVFPIRQNVTTGIQEVVKLGVVPDLIYIDAGHEYDDVLEDASVCVWQWPNAILVFDDCYKDYPGIQRFLSENDDRAILKGYTREDYGENVVMIPPKEQPNRERLLQLATHR